MRHWMFRALLCSATSALTLGCATDGGDGQDCGGGKCDAPGGNGSLLNSYNGSVNIYGGFHTLFDKTSAQCVTTDKDLANGAQINVGDVSETFELIYVKSREELAREIGIDLGVKVKYPAVSTDIGLNLVNKFKSTTTSVNLLVRVSQDYVVRNRHPVQLTDAGLGKLRAGAAQFVQTCGTNYINAVRYGGHLYVLITYDAADEETALEVKASLGVQAGGVLGTGSIDGDLKARLEQTASRSDVSVTVRVSGRGFDLGGSAASSTLVSDFVGAGVTDQTFKNIDELRGHMAKSVGRDACMDAGTGKCDGDSSPGYFDNVRRSAQTTGVEVGFYDAVPNAVFDSANSPFVTIRERLLLVERFVRDWAELQERMEVVYQNEIEPFLAASGNAKAGFQIAPPGAPARTPTELLAVANHWMDRFFPERGPQIGWAMQIAVQKQQDCWNASSVDLFHSCVAGDGPADMSADWEKVEAELDDYAASGRVLPLRFKAGDSVAHSNAIAECQSLSTQQLTYRLPTADEIKALDPIIGFGNVTWTGTAPHEVWFSHADPSSVCSDPDFPDPFYRNLPAASGGITRCAESEGIISWRDVQVVCVPSSGPHPLLEAP